MNAAEIVGVAAQLVGVAITVRAVWVTWHTHPTDEPFARQLVPRLRARWNRLLRALRIRRGPTVYAPTAIVSISTTGTPSLRITWPPLADDPDEWRAQVQQRLDVLHAAVQSAADAVGTEQRAREAADAGVISTLSEQTAAVERLVHGVATDGLRGQVVGAALVVVGVVCQVIGGL